MTDAPTQRGENVSEVPRGTGLDPFAAALWTRTHQDVRARAATETEWAWAAGLFEGEGSIVRGPVRPRLQLKMTDEDIVRRFRDIVGGVVHGPYQPHRRDGHDRKPVWLWQSDGADLRCIVSHFVLWLGPRRIERLHALGLLDDEPRLIDRTEQVLDALRARVSG